MSLPVTPSAAERKAEDVEVEKRESGSPPQTWMQRGRNDLLWGRPGDLPRPFQMMRRYVQDFDRFLGNWGFGGVDEAGSTAWPAVEMLDRNGSLVIRVELPGVNKEDVKVRAVGDGVVIEGERRNEHQESGEGFHRSEWSYGHFSRYVPLPPGVDRDQLRAQMNNNGILEISMPHAAESRPREIPIHEGERREEAKGSARRAPPPPPPLDRR